MYVKPWFTGSNELHLMPTKQIQTITMRQSTTLWKKLNGLVDHGSSEKKLNKLVDRVC